MKATAFLVVPARPSGQDSRRRFSKSTKDGEKLNTHPRILALKEELEKNRRTIDQIPQGVIEFILPIAVQKAIGSFTFHGVKNSDGTRILIPDLMAFQDSYTVKQADKNV